MYLLINVGPDSHFDKKKIRFVIHTICENKLQMDQSSNAGIKYIIMQLLKDVARRNER